MSSRESPALRTKCIRHEYFAEWQDADGQTRWRDLVAETSRINAIHD